MRISKAPKPESHPFKRTRPLEERYADRSGTDGRWYFVLVAGNRQVIGRSQMHTHEAIGKGVASVKKNAPVAETVDLSLRVRAAGGEGPGATLS